MSFQKHRRSLQCWRLTVLRKEDLSCTMFKIWNSSTTP